MNKVKNIRLSKSIISNQEINSVKKVLKKGYLGMGDEVKKFEIDLSNYFNRKVSCVSSGTAALHLSLLALGIKKNDEVLVPSITYLATYQAITATGAKPISCDIYENNILLNIEDVESKITKKTKVIIPVHYSGDTVNQRKIYRLSKKYNLRIVEDAAHAFGSEYSNKLIGSFGDIVCFSFDGIKNITTGEGGCVVSNDSKVINFVNKARLLGVNNETKIKLQNKRNNIPKVDVQGWRYHMSNINAAIGIEQLKRFEMLKSKRQKNAKLYDLIFKKSDKIKVYKRNYDQIVPHIYVIKILSKTNISQIRKKLLSKKIESGLHYYPNHKHKIFKNKKINLKNTEKIYSKLLTLPLHPDLSLKQIKYISKELLNILI
ncbi:DegT/DnrJ/EryC1/StrS family aminotransferase [Pelagibacteraceae bacterium]|nr:DegT/DnrJ/EryC1/StrS family aminotransferase [Pelagibacteraceae bacterium]